MMMRKQNSGMPNNHFLFDLKAVKECNNHLEESKSQDDNGFSEDSLFSRARKRLNLETALLEKSSVISENIDIKSHESESELGGGVDINSKTSPISDKHLRAKLLRNRTLNQDDIIREVIMKNELRLCQKLEHRLDP
jgi:hypothetical protein